MSVCIIALSAIKTRLLVIVFHIGVRHLVYD